MSAKLSECMVAHCVTHHLLEIGIQVLRYTRRTGQELVFLSP